MKKQLFLVFAFFTTCIYGQIGQDSLLTVWNDQSQSDSLRTYVYNLHIKREVLFQQPDSARQMANTLLIFGQQRAYPRAEAIAYNIIGISWHLVGDYPKSLEYYTRSLTIFRALGDERMEANALGNIGNIYGAQGIYRRALDYYTQNLKIFERLGNKRQIAVTLGNIGVVYENQKEYAKALEYYEQSLAMGRKIDGKRIVANSLGNMGNIQLEQGNYEDALKMYVESLKLNEEIGNKQSIVTFLGNISSVYSKQEEYTKALSYLDKSLKASIELGDKRGLSSAKIKIGVIYQLQGNHVKALEYCKEGYVIALNIGTLMQQRAACNCLYTSYKQMLRSDKALEYLETLKTIEDSLNAEETSKELQQMEFQKQVLADSIGTSEKERLVLEAHQKEMRQGEKTKIILGGVGILVLILAGSIYSRLRYTRKAKAIIEQEKDRSENLLLNILPADIAAELKEKGRAEARDFEKVSILFTDFKGFTTASEKLSAQELVAEINTCFEAFDGIMDKYSVEKIKTIGDAYMAAGGLPLPTVDSVKNTVLAALEMQAFISMRKAEMDAANKPAFEMRVGVHTGPVVAGIVGVKKFQYDIWGDTVNTASRMESAGEVGKVNISQATYELLKEDPDFTFENRGKIKAKGKGEIEMYFVS